MNQLLSWKETHLISVRMDVTKGSGIFLRAGTDRVTWSFAEIKMRELVEQIAAHLLKCH